MSQTGELDGDARVRAGQGACQPLGSPLYLMHDVRVAWRLLPPACLEQQTALPVHTSADGAEPFSRMNEEGKTAFDVASASGCIELIRLLLSKAPFQGFMMMRVGQLLG